MPAFVGTSSVYVPSAVFEYVYFIVPYFASAVGVFAFSPYVQPVIASGCVNSFVSKAIYYMTQDDYTHISISFEESLQRFNLAGLEL